MTRATPRPVSMGAFLTVLSLAGALAGGAAKAEPMTAAEFESYVTGRTLTYNSEGTPYGIEEYLPGRIVRWAFIGEECVDGRWYEEAGLICFAYENGDGPQCWTFEETAGGLVARFENDPSAPALYEARQSRAPLSCPGPKVGA